MQLYWFQVYIKNSINFTLQIFDLKYSLYTMFYWLQVLNTVIQQLSILINPHLL